MKRLNLHIAAITLLFGLNIATAQERPMATENTSVAADSIADLTARIMEQFSLDAPTETPNPDLFSQAPVTPQALAGRSLDMIPKSLRERFRMAATEIDSNPFADQTINEIAQHMQQMSSRFSQIGEMEPPQPNLARQAAAFASSNRGMPQTSAWSIVAKPELLSAAATVAKTGKAQSIAMSVANGIYSIEASVETEAGPQTVRLNGTKAEIQEQIGQLKPRIRKAIGTQLGL